MKVVLDTNVLLDDSDIINKYDEIILCSSILEELDGLKKSPDTKFRARQAIRKIEENLHKIHIVVKDIYTGFPDGWDGNLREQI